MVRNTDQSIDNQYFINKIMRGRSSEKRLCCPKRIHRNTRRQGDYPRRDSSSKNRSKYSRRR